MSIKGKDDIQRSSKKEIDRIHTFKIGMGYHKAGHRFQRFPHVQYMKLSSCRDTLKKEKDEYIFTHRVFL
jgi:hypothetical protein